jgi:hypothetical protein
VKEITPSALPKLAECALFTNAGGTSDAAARGTMIDVAIRELMLGNDTPFEALPAEDKPSAQWGLVTLRALGKGSLVETREEYLAMEVPGLSKVGTADAVCVDEMWVADIKTGQVRSYRAQLAAYALACMNDNFADQWVAHVVYVDQRVVRSYEFTRPLAEQIVAGILSRATSPEAEPTPCEYCTWCANFNSCTAIVRQSSEALALVKGERSLDEIRAEIAADPVQLSVFAANWKAAEKHLADPLIELLKARLSDGDDIPGWKVSTSAGREYVEADAIAKASANVSKETLILALGGKMSGKNFRQFCADSGVEVDESAVKCGAPITTLRQIKTKK